MSETSTQIHLEYIRDGVDRIDKRLDELNGRTRKVETLAAVHSWAITLGGAAALAGFGWLLSRF